MPLSSMLSKVGKEISNYKMDSDGNIVKKKKDTYQEQSYGGGGGGSYGYSNGHASNGYSNGGYSNGGGYDNRYGAPHYQQNPYTPPQGPPPGQYGGNSQYGDPQHQQYHYAPPQGPPPGQYGGHSQYGAPGGGRSRLPFQPKMEMWSEVASDGECYFYLGERKGATAFSAKMPLSSGNLKVNVGGRKSSSGALGEAKDVGVSKSSSKISLPNGFSCDLSKNSFTQIGQTSYSFTVPTDSGRQETFKWKLDDQGFKDMMKGANTGWSLIRAEEDIKVDRKDPEAVKNYKPPTPLAKFIDEDSMGMSSKMKMGWIEFVGEGASGSLGNTWAAVVLIAILKAKAKQAEKTIIQEVVGAI